MSCIPKILELKGDKKILPLSKASGIVIEDGGHHKGYDYLVTFTDRGFRCGYVAISSDHPVYNDPEKYPDFDVHGGVTFFDKSHIAEKLLKTRCEDKWIGFDCGHFRDIPDTQALDEYFDGDRRRLDPIHDSIFNLVNCLDELTSSNDTSESIKTKEFVVIECKKLIDQLIEKAA